MIITIDGPSASGKSSVARGLAKKFNLHHLPTGLLYRAAALLALEKLGSTCASIIAEMSSGVSDFGALDFLGLIDCVYSDGKPRIMFEQRDLTDTLSDSNIDQLASMISTNLVVREKLLGVQHKIAQRYDTIADGRDCGSVVFPNAEHKFFLTATVEARARRVLADVQRKRADADFDYVKTEIEVRDQRDQQRAVAPLKVPAGALVIDNSAMTLEQTIEAFARIIDPTIC